MEFGFYITDTHNRDRCQFL